MPLANDLLSLLHEVETDKGVKPPEEFDFEKDGEVRVQFASAQALEDGLTLISKLEAGTPSYERGRDGKSLVFPLWKNDKKRVTAAVDALKKASLVVTGG